MQGQVRALLIGLDAALAGQLEVGLAALGHTAQRSEWESCASLAARHEVIFAAEDVGRLKDLVCVLRSLRMHGPVIVASRMDDESAWLDALEAGADDYCSAPFERAQLRWILESKLSPGLHRAAAQ